MILKLSLVVIFHKKADKNKISIFKYLFKEFKSIAYAIILSVGLPARPASYEATNI